MIDSMEAMKVISQHRGQAIVVATMTAKNEWYQVSTHPELDLMYSGAMGKAASLGLGLALAQPQRKVIVLDGDGSLLMNLGGLITTANMAPPNLIHIVIENGVYRITGGQPIPNAGRFSFAALAREAGYAQAHAFEDLASFQGNISEIMAKPGPSFICLKTPPIAERSPYRSPSTKGEMLKEFRATLCSPMAVS